MKNENNVKINSVNTDLGYINGTNFQYEASIQDYDPNSSEWSLLIIKFVQDNTLPPILKINNYPPFPILTTNQNQFEPADLKKDCLYLLVNMVDKFLVMPYKEYSNTAADISSRTDNQEYLGETGVQSDWDETDSNNLAFIKNKPTIPVVEDGELDIQINSISKGKFTANDPNNKVVDITIPEKVTDLSDADDYAKKLWVTDEITQANQFLQYGTSAFPRSFTNKMQDYVSILDFIPEVEHDAIRDRTSGYDCLPALKNAMSRFTETTIYVGGPKIYFPQGTYYFSDTIQIKSTVILEGDGVGMNGGKGTTLKFPKDTSGIIVQRYNTINDGVESPATTAGDGSIIRNLHITGNRSGTIGSGIYLRARAFVENVAINQFSEHGIFIYAVAPASNANCWAVTNVTIQNVDGHGFYTDGPDSNAGLAQLLDVGAVGGCGIFDSSFLGNTYIGCHIGDVGMRAMVSHEGNRYYCINGELGGSVIPGTDDTVWKLKGPGGTSSYYKAWVSGGKYSIGYQVHTDNLNARNVFLGCYTEGGFVPSEIISPSLVLGGILGRGGGGGKLGNFIRDYHGLELSPTTILEPNGSIVLGAPNFPIRFRHDGDHSSGIAFQYTSSGALRMTHANLDARTFLQISNDIGGFTTGRPTKIGPGYISFLRGIWVQQRFIGYGTAVPTSDEWAKGDIIFNKNAKVGDPVGWICVTTGVAGVNASFLPFGDIGMDVSKYMTIDGNQTITGTKDVNAPINLNGLTSINGITTVNEKIHISKYGKEITMVEDASVDSGIASFKSDGQNSLILIKNTRGDNKGTAGTRWIVDDAIKLQLFCGGETASFFPNTAALHVPTSGVKLLLTNPNDEIIISKEYTNSSGEPKYLSQYAIKMGKSGMLVIGMVTESQRDALTNLEVGILLYQTDNDAGLYLYENDEWKKVLVGDVKLKTNDIPPSSNYTGKEGEMKMDSDYLYVCVSENNWKRTPLSSF